MCVHLFQEPQRCNIGVMSSLPNLIPYF